MENTYSKNSSVIPRNSLFIGHASNPPYPYYNTIKSIKFGLKIILIHLTSIINLIIPFHSVFITIQQSERNLFLKGTTFVYVLSSDWLNYWFDTLKVAKIFCKASCRRALQKICTCSLTHDVSSLEDDNVFVFCVAFS